MANQQRICVVAFIAFMGTILPVTNAHHNHHHHHPQKGLIKLSHNYHVYYEILHNKKIEFKITATNVTGWVGFGLNEKRENMVGADIFMGGVNEHGEYGDSYTVPGHENTKPTPNKHHPWKKIHASQTHDSTFITVQRNLKVHKGHGVSIGNKPINLIWAYNEHDDDVSHKHKHAGHHEINFHHSGASKMSSGVNFIVLFWACTMLCSKLWF